MSPCSFYVAPALNCPGTIPIHSDTILLTPPLAHAKNKKKRKTAPFPVLNLHPCIPCTQCYRVNIPIHILKNRLVLFLMYSSSFTPILCRQFVRKTEGRRNKGSCSSMARTHPDTTHCVHQLATNLKITPHASIDSFTSSLHHTLTSPHPPFPYRTTHGPKHKKTKNPIIRSLTFILSTQR